MTLPADKPVVTFSRQHNAPDGVMTGTTMAGAIVGGTIGAFAGGPVVTLAGMAVGALAARAITCYVHDEPKVPTNGPTPAS